MPSDNSRYLSDLHDQIDQLFNLEDVESLCFELGVDIDNVADDTKGARIRELILQLARHDRLPELLALLRQERPRVVWSDPPADFALPESLATAEAPLPPDINYYGPVTINQQGQVVEGPQVNAGGDVHIDHLGDNVGGDKVGGDKITVGDIIGATGVAIGPNAQATVTNISASDKSGSTPNGFAALRKLVVANSPSLVSKVNELSGFVSSGTADNDRAVAGLIFAIAQGVPGSGALIKTAMSGSEAAAAASGPMTQFTLEQL